MMPTSPTWALTLPSAAPSVQLVEPFLRATGAQHLLGDQRYHDLVVVVTEAVNNAIIHGNAHNNGTYVQLEVHVEQDCIRATITDNGSGFDPDALPDPRLEENVHKEGGRGVFLIRQLADSATFRRESDGMVVEVRYIL